MKSMKKCPLCSSDQSQFERILKGYNLLKCSKCDFVFADIANAEIERINATWADKKVVLYDNIQTVFDEKWFETITCKWTKTLGVGRVIDVGCGNGLLLKYFKSYGWDCFGIDISPWSENFSKQYGFKLLKGKIEDLVFEKNDFDLAVSTSTLEHIANPILHIDAVIALLKPRGFAYISGIPNYGSFSVLLGFSNFYR
jgi:2-polyprenyl-3-methyl-5-hydroxy-6-metoxy-1,4-benzoquinol methylase